MRIWSCHAREGLYQGEEEEEEERRRERQRVGGYLFFYKFIESVFELRKDHACPHRVFMC